VRTTGRRDFETLELLRRLESTYETHSAVLSRTQNDLTRLETQFGSIQSQLADVTAEVKSLNNKIDTVTRPNWGLIIGMIPAFSLLLAGFVYFVTSSTSQAILPIETKITQLRTDLDSTKSTLYKAVESGQSREQDLGRMAQNVTVNNSYIKKISEDLQRVTEMALQSSQSDANSRTDREQINRRMAEAEEKLSGEIAQRRSQMAAVDVHLAEIEQQFHAVANMENMRWTWQNRFNGMVFPKAFPGSAWPGDTFYPSSIFQGRGGSPTMPGIVDGSH